MATSKRAAPTTPKTAASVNVVLASKAMRSLSRKQFAASSLPGRELAVQPPAKYSLAQTFVLAAIGAGAGFVWAKGTGRSTKKSMAVGAGIGAGGALLRQAMQEDKAEFDGVITDDTAGVSAVSLVVPSRSFTVKERAPSRKGWRTDNSITTSSGKQAVKIVTLLGEPLTTDPIGWLGGLAAHGNLVQFAQVKYLLLHSNIHADQVHIFPGVKFRKPGAGEGAINYPVDLLDAVGHRWNTISRKGDLLANNFSECPSPVFKGAHSPYEKGILELKPIYETSCWWHPGQAIRNFVLGLGMQTNPTGRPIWDTTGSKYGGNVSNGRRFEEYLGAVIRFQEKYNPKGLTQASFAVQNATLLAGGFCKIGGKNICQSVGYTYAKSLAEAKDYGGPKEEYWQKNYFKPDNDPLFLQGAALWDTTVKYPAWVKNSEDRKRFQRRNWHYFEACRWYVWAGEMLREHSKEARMVPPTREWVDHCLLWGIGVPTEAQIVGRRSLPWWYENAEDGEGLNLWNGLSYKQVRVVLDTLMRHTPPPGHPEYDGTHIASGLGRRLLMDIPEAAGTINPPVWMDWSSWWADRTYKWGMASWQKNLNIFYTVSLGIFKAIAGMATAGIGTAAVTIIEVVSELVQLGYKWLVNHDIDIEDFGDLVGIAGKCSSAMELDLNIGDALSPETQQLFNSFSSGVKDLKDNWKWTYTNDAYGGLLSNSDFSKALKDQGII